MKKLASALYGLAGLVNLAPVMGVLSAERLQALYGVELTDPNLIILLRHRAVLFGIVGALLLTAAFRPALRSVAFPAGLVSMVSFILVAYLVGDFNAELHRIVWIDVVASVLLVSAGLMTFRLDRETA